MTTPCPNTLKDKIYNAMKKDPEATLMLETLKDKHLTSWFKIYLSGKSEKDSHSTKDKFMFLGPLTFADRSYNSAMTPHQQDTLVSMELESW